MNKTISFLTMTVLAGGLLIGGCSQSKHVGRQMVVEPDPVSLRLSSAVDRASAALQTLAAVEQHRTPVATVSPIANAPRELMRTISVEWTGPIEPIAQRLAERSGYKFSTIGLAPPIPVVISINAVEKTVIDVLRDLGLQSGGRADVIVNAEQKIIEISYNAVLNIDGDL